MGPGQLLDDERHALRLGVHRGDRLPLDRATQHLAQQQARLRGANRAGRSRRTRPMRSMSAMKLAASGTVANSSRRKVRNRNTGPSATERMT